MSSTQRVHAHTDDLSHKNLVEFLIWLASRLSPQLFVYLKQWRRKNGFQTNRED